MARIAGVNIPTNKRVVIALQYIHGIGQKNAKDIMEKVNIPTERRSYFMAHHVSGDMAYLLRNRELGHPPQPGRGRPQPAVQPKPRQPCLPN